MVNFKVSRGANSLSGNAAAPEVSQDGEYVNKKMLKENEEAVSLKVVALEKLGLTRRRMIVCYLQVRLRRSLLYRRILLPQ